MACSRCSRAPRPGGPAFRRLLAWFASVGEVVVVAGPVGGLWSVAVRPAFRSSLPWALFPSLEFVSAEGEALDLLICPGR